jgi:4-hydroxybenzoate polyprenyltransferase
MSDHNTGRLTSWIAVMVIVAGFIVGGLGLILGPSWVMFWVGVGIVVVGGIYALAVGIMEDYG